MRLHTDDGRNVGKNDSSRTEVTCRSSRDDGRARQPFNEVAEMSKFAKTTAWLALLFLVGVSGAHAQVSLGIRIGPPPAPRAERVRSASPGPGFVWIAGYQYPVGHKYQWHNGYWTRPPYEGASWVAPRHDGEQFYAGYWSGDRGRIEHDHGSDRNKTRDFREDDHR